MTTLAAKLQLFSATETNLAKLDALWRQIEGLVPCGYSLYSSPYYRLWWRFFFRPRIPLTIAA